jgi:hypothetical protein
MGAWTVVLYLAVAFVACVVLAFPLVWLMDSFDEWLIRRAYGDEDDA